MSSVEDSEFSRGSSYREKELNLEEVVVKFKHCGT